MNVWIVTIYEPLPLGDFKTRPQRCGMLAKALVERGHNIDLWTSSFDHVKHKHYHEASTLQSIDERISIQFIKGSGYLHDRSMKRLFHNQKTRREFIRLANNREKMPDIIFAPVPILELAEGAVRYGKKNGIPVVVDVRDLWPDVYLTFFPRSFHRIGKLFFFFEFRRAKYIFENARAITAVSNEYLRKGLSYAGRLPRDEDRFFPIGHEDISKKGEKERSASPLELVSVNEMDQQEHFVVTYVGTFSKFYDIQCIIDAARSLQYYEKIRIIIVGSGDRSEKFHEQAYKIANLIMTGWLDANSVHHILRQTSVGLVAYAKSATMSLPNKPFEYMAAGLPLLSSLPGELQEIINEFGIGRTYQAGDASSLANEIRWFYEHPEDTRWMGKRSRELFDRKFRSDVVYEHFSEHLEGIVRGNGK